MAEAIRVPANPLIRDFEAAQHAGVLEYVAACPHRCGWRIIAQWQPAKEFYLLAILAADDGCFDDGTFHKRAPHIERSQQIAQDAMRQHLAGCARAGD